MARGRRSAVSLQVVPALPGRKRPTPPPGLSEAENDIWTTTVSAMPSTWFLGSESVLRRYVVEVTTCEALEGRIRSMLAESGAIDSKLLASRARATSTLIKLATALRLTPGSRATPRRAQQLLGNAKSGRSRPWEIHPDAET